MLTADNGQGNSQAATVNWVTQTAFEPPLVVVGVKTDRAPIGSSRREDLVLNMLGKDHKGMAFTFFRPAQSPTANYGQAYARPRTAHRCWSPPRAAVECKVTSIVEQGDHHIVVGEVIEAHLNNPPAGRPDAAILEMKDLGDNVFYGG